MKIMSQPLTLSEVEKLVAGQVRELGGDVSPDFVHVYQESDAWDGSNLVIQVVARRPKDRAAWTRRRMRFSQRIRDLLVQRGDERYPLLQVFEPDEWPTRNA